MNYLITAGPTRESIDPVRFIGNRSSGRMGYALARAAASRGHAVCLVSGPVALDSPPGVECLRVVTAENMYETVKKHLAWCDVLVMAAAVADWRPETERPLKQKKEGRVHDLIRLVRTRDILDTVQSLKGHRTFVGFAAETDHVEEEAERKLCAKDLDLIVANDVSQPDAGFEVDTNRVTLIRRDGTREALPLMTKDEVAVHLLDAIEQLPKTC